MSTSIALLLALMFLLPAIAAAQVYTVISFDPKGDGRDASLADAAQLSYRHDKDQDIIWFRIALYGKANEQAFGVNLVIDTGGDEASKLNWWGGNKNFRFDKLVTAAVTRGEKGYEGTIGVSDAAGISRWQLPFLDLSYPRSSAAIILVVSLLHSASLTALQRQQVLHQITFLLLG